MNIGVDCRELIGKKAGKGWYVYHVLKNILEADHTNNYTLYSQEDIDFPVYDNTRMIKVPGNDLLWHFKIAKRLKSDGINLYWAPTSPIVPALTQVPTVMTIHDLTNLLFPKTHTLKGRLIEQVFLKRALKKTREIITISKATKEDLVKYCPEIDGKIQITPLGYDKSFQPLSEKIVMEKISKYKLEQGYILYVGTLEPRKNIVNLVKAYALLPEELKKAHPLVIAGKKGWKSEPIFEAIEAPGAYEFISYLEYVDFADLPALYNGASVFAFPSIYEGFGLPPLEAMACGVPVITSNVSSLPEVVGDEQLLCDPKNISDISEKILNVLTNNELREQLRKRALERARLFSWEKCARETVKILLN